MAQRRIERHRRLAPVADLFVGLQPWVAKGVKVFNEGKPQFSVGCHHARRSRCCVVLGTRTDDRIAPLHPSKRLERRRPRKAPLAFSAHPARVGQQSTAIRLPALDTSGGAGPAGGGVHRLAWRRRVDGAAAPAPTESQPAQPLRAANRRLAAGFMFTRQPGGGWRKTLGRGAPRHMNAVNPERLRGVRVAAFTVVAVFTFYVATVGSTAAIGRHAEDGCLQWMRDSSTASAALEIYEWPARQLAALPALRRLFELSAAFWCCITGAPETTG